jgi:hypothetical protein
MLGIIVFSLLFIAFVVFGTLFAVGKCYFLLSGYKSLTEEQKKAFENQNNLKKAFMFYSVYCFAVALVTLVALIGACFGITEVAIICYVVSIAGTIATMIVLNSHDEFKIVPLKTEIVVKSTPVVEPKEEVAVKVELVEEKPEVVVEQAEEKPAVKKAPAKKPAAAKTTTKATTTKKSTTTTTKKAPAKTTKTTKE